MRPINPIATGSPTLVILAGTLATASPALCAPATFVVAPNDRTSAEGNSLSGYPFDSLISMRYQQVFAASQFSSIGSGGGFIKTIAFRADGDCRAFHGQTDASLQINLSTTSKMPDSLSPVFAENAGLDDRVVRGPRSLTLTMNCDQSRPQSLSVGLSFDTPFFYNPASGNLLLDIRNFSGPMFMDQVPLDGENTAGDSVSRIMAFNVNASTAQQIDSFGLVTEFTIEPVPEPSTWALLGFGLGGIAYSTYRRSQRRKNGAQ